jgi:hypothetical protein
LEGSLEKGFQPSAISFQQMCNFSATAAGASRNPPLVKIKFTKGTDYKSSHKIITPSVGLNFGSRRFSTDGDKSCTPGQLKAID